MLVFWFVYLVTWFSFLLSLFSGMFAYCVVGVLLCTVVVCLVGICFWDNLLVCFVWCWFDCFVCFVMYVVCGFDFDDCVVF